MAALDWTFNEGTRRYTAIVDTYRLSLWENQAGQWSATVLRGGHGSARHTLKTCEDAMAWCQAEVARRAHESR